MQEVLAHFFDGNNVAAYFKFRLFSQGSLCLIVVQCFQIVLNEIVAKDSLGCDLWFCSQ